MKFFSFSVDEEALDEAIDGASGLGIMMRPPTRSADVGRFDADDSVRTPPDQ